MKRWISALPVAALAGCTTAPRQPAVLPVISEAARPSPAVCRVGPDGGPLMADRGIGGTGRPADRIADRGIGGTGIVGVITGFASVCVDGLEVQYNASSIVDVDGTAAAPSDLRVGEVVAIRATDSTEAPVAQSISVRHEAVGRIEAVALDTGLVTIAGQKVAISSSTEGADRFGLGDWVAASGLRRTDGVLLASRLDQAQPGQLVAHGQVVRQDGVARLGDLILPADAAVAPGQYVAVTGTYVAGHGRVATASADALPSNPGGYFGTEVRHLLVQGFVRVIGTTVRLNGVEVSADPALRGRHDGLAVVSLERRPDGSFAAVGLRYTDDHLQPAHKATGGGTTTQATPPAPQQRVTGGAALPSGSTIPSGPAATMPTPEPSEQNPLLSAPTPSVPTATPSAPILAPTPTPTPPVTVLAPTPTPTPPVTVLAPTPTPMPPTIVLTPTPTPPVTVLAPTPTPTPPVTALTPAPTPTPPVVVLTPTPTPTPPVIILTPTPTPPIPVLTPTPTPPVPAPTPSVPIARVPTATPTQGVTVVVSASTPAAPVPTSIGSPPRVLAFKSPSIGAVTGAALLSSGPTAAPTFLQSPASTMTGAGKKFVIPKPVAMRSR